MKLFSSPRVLHFLFSNWIWKGPDKNAVYLTFDDGPTKELTPWILELLRKKEIKATFFCVGDCAAKSPELIKQIMADGHALGHHTMHHENGWKTRSNNYINSIVESQAHINSKLFRPPYGKITFSQAQRLRKLGFKIIMWSWLSYDFDKTINAQKIIAKSEKIKGGDILVFHDNFKAQENAKKVLPYLISSIESRGLCFKLLS